MKTLVGGLIAASLITLAAPAAAQTLSSNPVVLQPVVWNPSSLGLGMPGIVHVDFQNTAPTSAREVRFLVTDAGGRQLEIEDLGTFNSGAWVHHTFHPLSLNEGAKVRIVHVTLGDGSTWSENATEALPRRQSAADNAAVQNPEYDAATQ